MADLDEPILPDDYPMYPGFIHVVDGKPAECLYGGNITVGRYKREEGAKEVRRCDLVERMARREAANG